MAEKVKPKMCPECGSEMERKVRPLNYPVIEKYICSKCGYYGETNTPIREAICRNCGYSPLSKATPKDISELREAIG